MEESGNLDAKTLGRMQKIYARCKSELPELEFWPSYYDRRMSEFLTYAQLLPRPNFGKVLEVGCGNGFYSALLSTLSDELVASDLENPKIPLHAQGLNKARTMISHLQIPNVRLQPAAVEALPFADESFDLVFSSHVMPYTTQPQRAVLEIERVLKPGGYGFFILPARMTSLYQLLFFQAYVMRRAFHHLLVAPVRKYLASPGRSTKGSETSHPDAGKRKFGMLKHFPFPPSYGGLPRWQDEFREWSPRNWRRLLTDEGRIPLLSQSTTQLNPLIPWVGALHPSWMPPIHDLTRGLELRLGGSPISQNLGTNNVIITRKRLAAA